MRGLLEMKKKNNGIIILMGIIIIMLIVLCVLFATNTIKFNDEVINNQTSSQGKEENKITETEASTLGKDLYDKATEIYSVWYLLPYCGYSTEEISGRETVKFEDDGIEFYESKYSSISELKSELANYFSEDIINSKVDSYDSTYFYKTENNKLYCRQTPGKGWLSSYLEKYDIKVSNIEENKVTYTITSYYAKDINKCNNIDDCAKDDIETRDTNFTIEKVNNNWIVTDYTLHE